MNYQKAITSLIWIVQDRNKASDIYDAFEMLRLIRKESK